MSKHLEEIIKRLGYADSFSLIRKSDSYNSLTLSAHVVKVLNSLSPFAAYMLDGDPFVLFFDEPENHEEQKSINIKIWNAQIPIAIFCSASAIKIFNGCTIDENTLLLNEAEAIACDSVNENTPFSFWEITDNSFWLKYGRHFEGKRLNEALLDNLTYLTEKLRNEHKIPFATKLVLRMIFIRYLIDRGVDLDYHDLSPNSDVEASRSALLSLMSDKDAVYALFAHLKEKFNGNLFDPENENPDCLTDEALNELKYFLSGDISARTGQLTLFPLYDFNIIPVELISNIYEILLGKETRDKDNAFYTPRYLVNYILDMTIDKRVQEKGTCKVLDPSCGSGVFLVDTYRRMIESKLGGALYTDDDSFLQCTLKENIFGIDLNPNAIDVAIFSLYLAVLDYKNPKTLERFQLPSMKEDNLVVCDFFDEDKLSKLHGVPFDFIIGNPPWSSKNGKHVDYCREHGYLQFMQNNDTCRAFILRSKDFAGNNPVCCFVLHSKMLYMQGNPSQAFRKHLLTNMKINRVVELSSVRKLVFKNADAPAVVLSYSFSDSEQTENRFEYISMKKNEFFRLFNIIVTEKTDFKNVQQKLLIENDWAWKTLVYGLSGDIEILRKLRSTKNSLEETIKTQCPAMITGTGVQYNDGDLNDASHLRGRLLLDSDTAIDHFALFECNTSVFEKTNIHRPRQRALFEAPYCLVMRGIDMDDYTMKAVYSEIDYVFREAVYAIKGTFEQKDLLLNITGLLNSQIYAYFNLMLGSSLGIEREQRQAKEVLSFPFIYRDDIATKVENIQKIKKMNGEFIVEADISSEIQSLNNSILDALGLMDNEFIDYAIRIQIPQIAEKNNSEARRKATVKDYEAYGKYLYNNLSEIFTSAGKHVKINAYPSIGKHYCAVEVIVLDEKPDEWFALADNPDQQKIMLTNLSAHKINDLFYTVKDVLYFEESSFYIIKTNYYKNWHPAIAWLDLMEVTDQILSRKNEEEN